MLALKEKLGNILLLKGVIIYTQHITRIYIQSTGMRTLIIEEDLLCLYEVDLLRLSICAFQYSGNILPWSEFKDIDIKA